MNRPGAQATSSTPGPDAWGHEESDSQEANGLLAWEQRAKLLKPTTLDGNLEKSGQGQECG